MRRIAVTCAVVCVVAAIPMHNDGRDAAVNHCAVPQCEH